MNRLWSRIGVRTASVALLAAGVAGGVYLGPGHDDQSQAKGVSQRAEIPMLTDADEMQLLKSRQAEHAAARAARTQVRDAAARRAAGEAKVAAGKARKLEKAAIAKKAEEKQKAEEKAKENAEETGGTSPSSSEPVDIPSSCNEYSGNKAIGCALLLDAGFGLNQMGCLDKLWTRESHWKTSAHNSGSGAHGIPQAVPGNKMAAYGSDWRTSARTQIKWGLSYIKGRYDTPCGAWSHSESTGWY